MDASRRLPLVFGRGGLKEKYATTIFKLEAAARILKQIFVSHW